MNLSEIIPIYQIGEVVHVQDKHQKRGRLLPRDNVTKQLRESERIGSVFVLILMPIHILLKLLLILKISVNLLERIRIYSIAEVDHTRDNHQDIDRLVLKIIKKEIKECEIWHAI